MIDFTRAVNPTASNHVEMATTFVDAPVQATVNEPGGSLHNWQDLDEAGTDGHFLTYCRSPEQQAAARLGRQRYEEIEGAGPEGWLSIPTADESTLTDEEEVTTIRGAGAGSAQDESSGPAGPEVGDTVELFNTRDSIKEHAERLLMHLLRSPKLCAAARGQLGYSAFWAAASKDLGHVWTVVMDLVQEHGVHIVSDTTWRYRLETAVRAACKTRGDMVSTGVPDLLTGDCLQPSFFDRTFALETFDEGEGQLLLQQFVYYAKFVDPLQKLASSP